MSQRWVCPINGRSGHLLLERVLEHPIRQPVQQPFGADQLNTLFLRSLQQLLRELLLVDVSLVTGSIIPMRSVIALPFRSGQTRSTFDQTVPRPPTKATSKRDERSLNEVGSRGASNWVS